MGIKLQQGRKTLHDLINLLIVMIAIGWAIAKFKLFLGGETFFVTIMNLQIFHWTFEN